MIKAFSFPVNLERSRIKERLEASLAGLCELHFLKQRQEYLVQKALQIGTLRDQDFLNCYESDGRDFNSSYGLRNFSEDSTLKRQLNGLKSHYLGLISQLEQQVGELRLDVETGCGESTENDSRPSSGFYEMSEGPSPAATSDSPGSVFGECFSNFQSVACSYSRAGLAEARINYANERPKSVGELGSIEREENRSHSEQIRATVVPRSFSAPYSNSQEAIADVWPKYQCDLVSRDGMDTFSYPSPLHAVAMQSPMLCQPLRGNVYEERPFNTSSLLLGYKPDLEGDMSYSSVCHTDFQPYTEPCHPRKVENYIIGLIQRRNYLIRSSKPRTSFNAEPLKGLARQNSLCMRQPELLNPQSNNCELKYPQSERANISSSYNYEGNGLCGKFRPQWNPGTEMVMTNKNIQSPQATEVYTTPLQQQKAIDDPVPPHPLRKQPKLVANFPPLRPASLEYYELNYQASLHSPQESHSFELAGSEMDDVTHTFKPASPRNDSSSSEIHSPTYEERLEGRGKRSPLQSMDDVGCHMVNAQYIPAQQPSKAQAASRSLKNKNVPSSKGRPPEISPDRGPPTPREKPKAMTKKCRFSEEAELAKKGAKKTSPRGKKTCRSQSENSLLNRQGVIDKPVTKYNTVDRDEAILGKPPRQKRQNGGSYRKWRSTVEICQDEVVPSDSYKAQKRGKKLHRPQAQPLLSHAPRSGVYGYVESDSEYSADCGSVQRAPVCEPEDDLSSYTMNCFGDSESSLSEVDSPGFSTCSSDTDESGGLVWPQQVPPQLVASSGSSQSGTQPKVFVKIKASHALKKKIMRFRTGSLKVMTTV